MDNSSVITDAELVNKFTQAAMEEPASKIKTKAPSKPLVKLPGGILDNNELVTAAEVRELTGVDEEAIYKASTTGKALNLILQRGLVSIGSREADRKSTRLNSSHTDISRMPSSA